MQPSAPLRSGTRVAQSVVIPTRQQVFAKKILNMVKTSLDSGRNMSVNILHGTAG